jgi:hypothetical protein
MNERYGKHTAPSGKTRKSAAAAKPKRKAGTEAQRSSSKRPTSSAGKKRQRIVINPPTPEFKKWRRIWWVFLGLAIAFSTVAYFLWRDEEMRAIGNWVLGAGYAMIAMALAIDWMKLRPLRRAWLEAGSPEAVTNGDEKS